MKKNENSFVLFVFSDSIFFKLSNFKTILLNMSCSKPLKQQTLGKYLTMPSIMKVKQSKAKRSPLADMPKRSYERHGVMMNVKGTMEHGLIMDGSNAEYEKKARRIVKWSESRPKFDISAICGILNNADFTKKYSSSQRDAIDNIYYRCDVWMDY